jgi:hypothetical protein
MTDAAARVHRGAREPGGVAGGGAGSAAGAESVTVAFLRGKTWRPSIAAVEDTDWIGFDEGGVNWQIRLSKRSCRVPHSILDMGRYYSLAAALRWR